MSTDDAYVIFSKAKSNGWMFKLLHPMISHCFLIIPDRGRWIIYDNSVMGVSIFTVDSHGDIMHESIAIKVNLDSVGGYFNLNTCVSSVKAMIGITNPFIVTPYQLFKRLSKCQVKAPPKS